jgi:small subunit ribosomal protein S20
MMCCTGGSGRDPTMTGRVIQRNYDMANTKSAKKAARQAIRRTEVNKSRTTRARTVVRSVEEAIASGNKDAAAKALREAGPVLARTAQKGVIHKKTASSTVSRQSARVKAMAK